METLSSKDLQKKAFRLAVGFMIFHLILSIFRAQLAFMVPPLMTVLVEDLGISFGSGGLLQTTSTFVMGVGMVLGTFIVDRIGSSKTLVLAMISMFISGLIGFFSNTFTSLLIARIFMGAGNALSFMTVMMIISERFHNQKQRGMASSLVQATNSLTSTLAFAFTYRIFTALGRNWNNQMLLWGSISMVLAIVFFIGDRKPARFFDEYNAQRAGGDMKNKEKSNEEVEESGSSLVKAMKFRIIWSAVISFAGATWLFMLYNIYLPTVLVVVHEVTPEKAGAITSLINLAGIISCIICGLLLGKVNNFKLIIGLLMVGLCVGGVGAILLEPGILQNISIILIGISFSSYVPVINTAIMMASGITPKIFAAANALWTVLGNVMSMLIPILFDALQQSYGMQASMLILCSGGILAIGGALLYPGKGLKTNIA